MLDATPRLSALGSSSSGYSVGRPVGWRRILGPGEASGSDENVTCLSPLAGLSPPMCSGLDASVSTCAAESSRRGSVLKGTDCTPLASHDERNASFR